MYVEPEGYFTESMKKILEEGEQKESKKTPKKKEEAKSKHKEK